MGWFDKKSWQLRRKIRDLQSELAVAERDGKYVIEQGLFFAELREMGDQTMMVLGAANQLDTVEEEGIRNFFERNGFSVELRRLDKTHKSLAAVEIIPPEELTKHVARSLQDRGYRLLDDSEQERRADMDKQLLTLSSLLRTITALFVGHVHHIIISTPIKLNMEGNRLLHWMPRIREVELAQIPNQLVSECVDPFVDAYNHYYGRFGTIEEPEVLREMANSLPVRDVTGEMASIARNTEFSDVTTPASGSALWQRQRNTAAPSTDSTPTHSSTTLQAAPPVSAPPAADRETEAARMLAHMYRSLIGASDQRKVRNAEGLLETIGRFFSAKSTCILTRASSDAPLRLHANSGTTFCIATDEDGAVTCETEAITKALATGKPAFSQPEGNGNTGVEAVAVPLDFSHETTAVIYLLEPANFSPASEGKDVQHIMEFSKVFREYPDLLI